MSPLLRRTRWHGTATASVFAPQACAIYLSQSLRFMRPVKVGDTIRATVEVKGLDAEKRTLTLETECFNQNNDLVTKGEAVIMLDPVNA